MRKVIGFVVAAVCAGVLWTAAPAEAEPSDLCGGGVFAGDPGSMQGFTICFPGVGAIRVERGGGFGSIVFDDNSSNPGCTAGYVGVEANLLPQVNTVWSRSGDYTHDSQQPEDINPSDCVS
jgi:hypothetical protein